jgi:hypothetical protein
MAKAKKIVKYRSAKSGEYVTKWYALRHPFTTVREVHRG